MHRNTVRGNLHLTIPFSKQFVFNPSGTIISKWKIVREAGEIINKYLKPQKIMLVTDVGMKETGIFEEVRSSLIREQLDSTEFVDKVISVNSREN